MYLLPVNTYTNNQTTINLCSFTSNVKLFMAVMVRSCPDNYEILWYCFLPQEAYWLCRL